MKGERLWELLAHMVSVRGVSLGSWVRGGKGLRERRRWNISGTLIKACRGCTVVKETCRNLWVV